MERKKNRPGLVETLLAVAVVAAVSVAALVWAPHARTTELPREPAYERPVPGQLVVVLKPGCPDCIDVKDALAAYLAKNHVEDVAYATVGTPAGDDLVRHAHIDEVPAAVYFMRTPASDGRDFVWRIIYKKDDDGRAELDTAALDSLLASQRNGR